ncbi:LD-carboxypeptidase [Halobacteria archaeon HArc-gm2]|nr:LD-carboxypeptidase [Halobacteria archaeon HArc-gm2]
MADEFTIPPAASPGDRVAVVAPSSGAAAHHRDVLTLGLDRLGDVFDLEPVVYPTARQSDRYLRDRPRTRAADVHAAFRDPDISAVFATIGGDDQLRVLKHLDPDVLRANPTRFFGMSDNTNLALSLWNQGLVSFYGGQILNQIATPGFLPKYTERYLRRALFEESIGEIEPAEQWTDDVVDWGAEDYADQEPEYEANDGWRWHGDRPVEGRLWGGCLAILRWQLAANRYLPDAAALDGEILALETSEQLPSADRVRWTLQAMGERGLLERFDGVLVGRPQSRHRFDDRSDDGRTEYRRDQRDAVRSMLDRYNPAATAVFDLDFGHTNPTVPVPIGGQVEMDPATETIRFP